MRHGDKNNDKLADTLDDKNNDNLADGDMFTNQHTTIQCL